jgi:hypothetical protein
MFKKNMLHQKYLNGTAINQEPIQLLESGGSAIRPAESDVGDSTALRVGAVNQLNPLDGANRLDEIFLGEEVALVKLKKTGFTLAFRLRASSIRPGSPRVGGCESEK